MSLFSVKVKLLYINEIVHSSDKTTENVEGETGT